MNETAKAYLEKYLNTLTPEEQAQERQVDAYYFCSDQESANTCARLVREGEKRATASLLWAYQEGERLPQVGDVSVITDWDGEPQCVIEVTSVEIRPFNQVDAEFAYEEGEGDKSLDFWRREHWKFFEIECQEVGRAPTEEMSVVLERFKLVFQGDEL